jgi:hypothetical protein
MRRAELSRQAAFETEAAFLLAARGSELGTGSLGTVSCMYVRASELTAIVCWLVYLTDRLRL